MENFHFGVYRSHNRIHSCMIAWAMSFDGYESIWKLEISQPLYGSRFFVQPRNDYCVMSSHFLADPKHFVLLSKSNEVFICFFVEYNNKWFRVKGNRERWRASLLLFSYIIFHFKSRQMYVDGSATSDNLQNCLLPERFIAYSVVRAIAGCR